MIIEALQALCTAKPLPIIAAIAAYLAGTIAVGLRLRAAAAAVDLELPTVTATEIGLSGVLASHLAFGGAAGEVARLGWLRRMLHDRADASRRAVAAIAIVRVADGATIAALVLCTLASRAPYAMVLAPFFLGALALVVVVRIAPLLRARRLIGGVLVALPASLATWTLDLMRTSLVAHALGTKLSLAQLTSLALAALVGGQAPTPGGVGTVEAAMVATGLALGLPTAPLVALIVADRALSLCLGTGLGALASARLVRARTWRTA